MKKKLLLMSAIGILGCPSKKPNRKTAYKIFAQESIPFVVADSVFMTDMKENHRAVVKIVFNQQKGM